MDALQPSTMSTGSEKTGFGTLLPKWVKFHVAGIFYGITWTTGAGMFAIAIVAIFTPQYLTYTVTAGLGASILVGTMFASTEWDEPEKARKFATSEDYSLIQAAVIMGMGLVWINVMLIAGTAGAIATAQVGAPAGLVALAYPFADLWVARRAPITPGYLSMRGAKVTLSYLGATEETTYKATMPISHLFGDRKLPR